MIVYLCSRMHAPCLAIIYVFFVLFFILCPITTALELDLSEIAIGRNHSGVAFPTNEFPYLGLEIKIFD